MRSPFTRTALPGEVLMVLVAILWGSAFPVTRLLLQEMPPLGAAAWRMLVAGCAIALFAALRGEFGMLWPAVADRRRLAVLALLGGACFLIGMNLAIFLTGASISSFVVGTYPLLAVVVAAFLLGEPLGGRVIAALLVAALGLVLLARPGGPHVEPLGVVVAIGAALSFATYLGLARRWADPVRLPTLTVAFWVVATSTLVGSFLQLVLDAGALVPRLSLGGWTALLWLGLPASALPHVLVISTLRRMPAGRAAPFLMLMPISGALIAAALLGERLDQIQLAGAGLILLGIAAATLRGRAE